MKIQSRLFHKRYGLHKKTYLTVLMLLAFILLVMVLGKKAKIQQDLTRHYMIKSAAYSQELKKLKTYTKPTIDLDQKARAIYIIQKVWRKDYKIGVAIASCESGFREKVVNPIGATGYFQVMPLHGIPTSDLQNGWVSAGYAYSLYMEQGINPWISSKSCWTGRL